MELEASLSRNMRQGKFAERTLELFADFYDSVLNQHDRIVVTDIASIGAQPLTLFAAWSYLKEIPEDQALQCRMEVCFRFLNSEKSVIPVAIIDHLFVLERL